MESTHGQFQQCHSRRERNARPQVKVTPIGTAVAEIGLAVNRKWKDEATFVDATLQGRAAEIAGEYLRKGKSVLIEGRSALMKGLPLFDRSFARTPNWLWQFLQGGRGCSAYRWATQ